MKTPKNKRILGCKQVFKNNEGSSKDISPIYKARIIAKGYSKIKGIDFHVVFSPVVKHPLIRVVEAMVLIDLSKCFRAIK